MVFVPGDVTEFRYLDARIDRTTGLAEFSFAFVGSGDESFVERIGFTLPEDSAAVDWERVQSTLVLLGAVLSTSYYKAAAPSRFVVEAAGLGPEGVRYLSAIIENGLGEFAYRAGLPGLLTPEIVVTNTADTFVPWTHTVAATGAPLVAIGGGKDSVMSVESTVDVGFAPVQFAVNPNSIIKRVAAVSGHPLVTASRTIDRRLLELNAEGALNGHVPVTAMNSLIAVIQSQLLGLGPVVMSNESSASDPTLQWNGRWINHQWSKSLEAERALVSVLADQVGLTDAYFSLLRPFSELRIARGFAGTTKYDAAIVSCNRAYRLGAANVGWCGDCDKCRFVFLAFAPFMSGERLTGIFGKNMFDDATQLPGYRALLGLDAHKPFECVGEEAECSVAMSLAARSPEWSSTAVLRALVEEIPTLATGDPALERQVFADSDALALTEQYEKARHALV
ncbi:hypothetical protein [Glaciihabitans sp. dw_435]|uniref:hypothetical protein n=1 Tax=Glaciihabitans sp. dw_435 TaxID=2720081 RepID=UPI001BD6714B|nr:hypothetical protein [Glaciihabitans sp. dw_435]